MVWTRFVTWLRTATSSPVRVSGPSRTNGTKPLPRRVQYWRRTRERRQQAFRTFKITASKALTLAISVLGAILISFGVWSIYAPAGYIVGGFICWMLLWSHEQDKGGRE